MFSIRDGCAVALLLAAVQTVALASLKEDEENRMDLAKILVTSLSAPLIDGIESTLRDSDSDSRCVVELSAFANAIAAGETWALTMLDASSKIQSGILNGNIYDLGMYGQCIRASGQYNNTDVQGRHCTVTLTVSYEGNSIDIGNASIALTSSICVPSSCDASQVATFAKAAYGEFSEMFDSGLILNVTASSCARIESEDFTVGEISTIVFFTVIVVFILFCTICDFVKRSKLTNVNGTIETLAKFSLWTNAQNIFSTRKTPGVMPALQGIRFLCMCWVILGHRYVTSLFRPMVNIAEIPDWMNRWDATYIQLGPYAVDTFFVISGFLMTYQYSKTLQSGKRLNIPMMYIHRYIRLTPSIVVVMLFVMFLLQRVANGPIWSTISLIVVESCQKNWWVNLLYVQNFVNAKSACLPHSWYLAVDMQLFWISPIILYPLYRWPKYGLTLLTFLLGVSLITPVVVLSVNNYYNAIIRFDNSDPNYDTMFYLYIPTYNRASGYLIGVFLGYELANHKRNLHKATVAIFWIMFCAMMVFCGWLTHIIYRTEYEYNKPLEMACALVLRPIWSVATAWLVYACTQGYGGFVTKFLSMPLFLPLSRLSYCIYLVHMVIQLTKNSAEQIPGIFLQFSMFNEFVADLALSVVIALLLSLCFESPVIILEKLLRNRGRKPKRSAPNAELKEDVEVGIDNRAMTLTTQK